eukprot:GFUD01080593.1.p1 GENE.GFUD01080593.1~~GFUD01080593.1.p1  ORF type:complete len:160 (+),score=44.69 GFUD01080593.1:106-585(+)
MADESQPSSHPKDKEDEPPTPHTPEYGVQLSPRHLLTKPEMSQRTLQNNAANMYHVPEGLNVMEPSPFGGKFGGMPPFHGLSGGPRGPPPWGMPSGRMPGPVSPGLHPWYIGNPGPGMPPMGQGKWSEHMATDGTKSYYNAETQESIVILFLGGQKQKL